MPVPYGPFRQAPRQPPAPHARQPSSVDSSTRACVAETPLLTFTNAAPATSPDTAHKIVAQGNQPAGVPLHQQSPWTPVHLDRLESALARHPAGVYAARLQEWFPCQLMHQHSTQLKCCFSYPTEFLHILLRLGEINIHKLLDDDVIATHL